MKYSYSVLGGKVVDIKLVAYNIDLYYAWRKCFENVDNVEVIDGDILKYTADAIVSPANSFGYMDGGLDLKYSQHFGWKLEQKVRDELEAKNFGEIPVGQALIIETAREDIPYLIMAPTMRVPMDVSDTVNAYLAFKAILQSVLRHNQKSETPIRTLQCPGLATGEGRMPPGKCAKQMLRAYEVCMLGKFETKGGLAGAAKDHIYLSD